MKRTKLRPFSCALMTRLSAYRNIVIETRNSMRLKKCLGTISMLYYSNNSQTNLPTVLHLFDFDFQPDKLKRVSTVNRNTE